MRDNCVEKKNKEYVAQIQGYIDQAMLAEGLVNKRNSETLEQDWQSSGIDEKCWKREIRW